MTVYECIAIEKNVPCDGAAFKTGEEIPAQAVLWLEDKRVASLWPFNESSLIIRVCLVIEWFFSMIELQRPRWWFAAASFIVFSTFFHVVEARAGSWEEYENRIQSILSAANQRLNRDFSHESPLSVQIEFRLKQQGELTELKITAPSGDQEYDLLAVDAVRASAPFPALPFSVYYKQVVRAFAFTFSYQPAPPPPEDPPEDPEELAPDPVVMEIQGLFKELGYDAGPIDGIFGPSTEGAITAFQRDLGTVVDGLPGRQLLESLRTAATQPRTNVEPRLGSIPDTVVDPGAENLESESPARGDPDQSARRDVENRAVPEDEEAVPGDESQSSNARLDIGYWAQISLPDNIKPIVLVMDGLGPDDPVAMRAATVSLDEVDGISYLTPALRRAWPFVEKFEYQAWRGNYQDLVSSTPYAKSRLERVAMRAREEQRPLIVVSHGWGSVLAFIAVSELAREDKLRAPVVDQFVTLGSPLSSRTAPTKELIEGYAGTVDVAAALTTIGQWTNYGIEEDDKSGPFPHAAIKNIELKTGLLSRLRPAAALEAHSLYWDDSSGNEASFANCIGLDRKYELVAPYLHDPNRHSFCSDYEELASSQTIYGKRHINHALPH